MCKSQPNCAWEGRGQVMLPITKSWGFNHITETAEPKVVKFCTRVGYILFLATGWHITTKGRGYGHVTVLKFCRLSWCSASRGFVSDSWATCVICSMLYAIAKGQIIKTPLETCACYCSKMVLPGPFLQSYSVFVLDFSIFFVSVPCTRLSWSHRQLLSTRKYIVS